MENENLDPSTVQSTTEKPSSKKTIIFISIGILAALTIGSFSFVKNSSSKTAEKIKANLPIPTPTPYPFRELTIPYLRERTYKSSIGEKTIASENGNYTSYITSYDSDGLKINGLLTEPTGEMPTGGWPAIVFIHGYIPPSQYETNGAAYSAYVDYLANNGFVVFKIDLRGHGTSEGKPSGAYFSGDYIVDALNAYSALQNTDFINPKKIGLWGHSMAGNVSLRALAVKPDIPAVAIWGGAVYSYTDRQKYGIEDASYQPSQNDSERQKLRQRLSQIHGADYNPESIFWREFVPTNYLQDIKGAIQLDHAVDDAVVNVGYSRDLVTLLDKTTIPHEINEYPSGGHNISGVSFGDAMQDTVEFYKKYLNQ